MATPWRAEVPPPPAVLILTTFHLDSYVIDALEAGARGYLLKDTAPGENRVQVALLVRGSRSSS